MFPLTARWVRVYAFAAGAVGALFLIVGLLSTWSVHAESSGATRMQGTVGSVQAPTDSTDSVHLMVKAADGRTYRVASSSETPSDFSPGERTAFLVTRGQEPVQDDGAGRYAGSLVAVIAGLAPLAVSMALWRSRERLAHHS